MFVDCPALDTSTKATPQLPAAEQHALIKPQTPNTPVCCRSPGAWTEPGAVTRRVQLGARASVRWMVSPTPSKRRPLSTPPLVCPAQGGGAGPGDSCRCSGSRPTPRPRPGKAGETQAPVSAPSKPPDATRVTGLVDWGRSDRPVPHGFTCPQYTDGKTEVRGLRAPPVPQFPPL